MYIYSYYNKMGLYSPEELIKAASNNECKEICLIDDNGLGIPSFLNISEKYNKKVSFAINFDLTFENEKFKKKGYFITGTKNGLKKIMELKGKFSEDFIPYIKQNEIDQLYDNEVYIFVKHKKNYYEYTTNEMIDFKPVAFKTNEEKEKYSNEIMKESLYSLEEINKSDDFVKEISSETYKFKKNKNTYLKNENIKEKINFNNLDEIEKKRAKMEYLLLREEGFLCVIEGLKKCKDENIEFEIKGEYEHSLLLYSLGITKEKVKKDDWKINFSKTDIFEVKVDERNKEKIKKILQNYNVKFPFVKEELYSKNALFASEKLFNLNTNLSEKIKEKETVTEFKKRNKLRLTINEKEKQICDLAIHFEKFKNENFILNKEYLFFTERADYCVKNENGIFIDINDINKITLPYIKFI